MIRIIFLAVFCLLGACTPMRYDGQTIIHRESIRISQQVAAIIRESDRPVVLEEDSRIYCARKMVTGSHIPFTYCQTKSEYNEMIRLSKMALRAPNHN